MIYDPKTIRGDILASLMAKPADYDELLSRFDNSTNGLLGCALWGTLTGLQKDRYIHEDKSGKMHCTRQGRQYLHNTGEYDV